MKRTTNSHTTVILLMLDGTHRYLNATYSLTNKQVWDFVRDVLRHLEWNNSVYEMFLACGMQSLRYTQSEVLKLAEKE